MKILFIDIKQDKNGRDYKSAKLDTPVHGKDRFNVFPKHPRFDDVVVGATFAPEDFVQDGAYINLADPNKGVKTAYGGARANFNVALAQDRKQEGIQSAQAHKDDSIKTSSTARDATLILTTILGKDPATSLDWRTEWVEIRNWLWNHWDRDFREEPPF